jgi:hypothetical protein
MSHEIEAGKAKLLGERLVGSAPEAARIILEELGKGYKVVLRNERSVPQFIIEVMVFCMHLIDRSALAQRGVAKRKTFCDHFVAAVLEESTTGLMSVAPNDFGKSLLDTYDVRQVQYAEYEILMSEKDQPLKGTLFWEFSKLLSGFLERCESHNCGIS